MALLSIFPGVKKCASSICPLPVVQALPGQGSCWVIFGGEGLGSLVCACACVSQCRRGKYLAERSAIPVPSAPGRDPPLPWRATASWHFVALPCPQGVLLPYPWASSRFPQLALCQRDCSPLSPWGHMSGGAGSRPLSSYPHRPNSGPNSSGLILICLCTNLPTAPLICCTAGWAAYPPRFQPFSMCLLGCKKIALLSPPSLLISGTSWREPLPASWHRVRSQSTPPQQYHPGCPLSYTVEGGS